MPHAFVVRYFDPAGPGRPGDRLLLVNLGPSGPFTPAPEPLLAPPAECGWRIAWTSEAADYGGIGTPDVITPDGWRLPGRSAVLLEPEPAEPRGDAQGQAQKRQRNP
jgi:maltooligosyltrehalose trehalohydrolase